jgi:hypothetical protein
VAGVAAYSDDWDRSASGQSTQQPGELKPIHARHANIQENHIRATEAGGLEGAGTAVTGNGFVSPDGQKFDCAIGRIDQVIYHKNVIPSKVHSILRGSLSRFCFRPDGRVMKM